jgi:hypothetical protein
MTCEEPSDANAEFGKFSDDHLYCVPTNDPEELSTSDVLQVEIILISGEGNTALNADWAGGDGIDLAIQNALSDVMGLYTGQIFIMGFSDYGSRRLGDGRRLSATGLKMKVMIQLYARDDVAILRQNFLQLGSQTFTNALTAALTARGIDSPSGLTGAEVTVAALEERTATLPVSRWVATTGWSQCDNACGTGKQTRTIECVTGVTELCDKNIPLGETFPAVQDCEDYSGSCGDWTCPGGPDENGEGCETQASVVIGAIAVSFFICCCLGLLLLRQYRMRQAAGKPIETGPRAWDEDGGAVRDPVDDRSVNIEWTREEGVHLARARSAGSPGHTGPRHMGSSPRQPSPRDFRGSPRRSDSRSPSPGAYGAGGRTN